MDVRDVKNQHQGQELKRSNMLLEKTTRRMDNRFETGLLWKTDDFNIPDSNEMVIKRQLSLEKKFNRDPEYRKQYCKLMLEYEQKGYIWLIQESEQNKSLDKAWYLPHFGVVNPHKPGKIRIVFDAAAEVDGVSLNALLMRGSDQCQPLSYVLMKFRQRSVGICADIEEMFHRVLIRKEDRWAQRVLWRKDETDEFKAYEMMVMTFGGKCSPASAQFVKNKNASEYKDLFPQAADAIVRNHYVDDFVHSYGNETEAI
ncbi:uncharacterized protein LOC124462034 [Drosophila willistoni]|uniref:uncharacterized protein LOC124462034 n=1 Tax=Drosophila willistoni TaxID=7260 RepID=UPI001F0771EB|nr:uncharacterized protein LOC124462034 [Drosophila willistoni]